MKYLVVSSAAVALSALSLAFFPIQASAQTSAFTVPAGTVGTQSAFNGPLGEDFSVSGTGIFVFDLGAFDSGSNGLSNTINVGIFNNSTQSLVMSASLTTSNSTLASGSGYRYLNTFSPIFLAAGSYRIVASDYGGSEPNGNNGSGSPVPTTNTGGGLVTYGSSFYGPNSPALVYPTNMDSAGVYLAGSFQFQAVPEPATWAMMGSGFGVLLAVGRARSKRHA